MRIGERVLVWDNPTYEVPVKRKDKVTGKMKDGVKNLLDLSKVQDLIEENIVPQLLKLGIVEEQAPRKRDGKSQVASILRNYGSWLGILAANRFQVTSIKPAMWKRKMKIAVGADKEESRRLAIELYPELKDQLKFKKNHGRAEALLLLKVLENIVNEED
jgi:hypothetical protein